MGSIIGMALLSMKAWDTWYYRFAYGSNPAGTAQRKAYYIIGYEVLKDNMMFGIGINQFGSNGYRLDALERVLEYDIVKNDKLLRKFIQDYKRRVENGLDNPDADIKNINSGGTPESF